MTFRMQEFEDKKTLEDYIAHEEYGIHPEKPAICFGF